MNTRHRLSVAAGLVGLSAAVSLLAAPSLPDHLVTHWSAAGEPDGSMAKGPALALIPVLAAGLVALLATVPRIDPLGENVEAFRVHYDRFVVALAAFMLVIHVGIVAYNLGYEFDFTLVILAAVAVLLYYVGIVLAHAERNWFVGVRTPWTLHSDEVWDRTHRLAGRLFKLTAVLTLVGLAFDEYAIYFLLVPAVATAIVTTAYSYYCYARLAENGDSTAGTKP